MRSSRGTDAPRYVSDNGVEVTRISAEQMREIDQIAMEITGPNLFQMMENAGRSLAEMAMQTLGRSGEGAAVVVLAGSGGNGGGGICAARHLINHGVDVRLCLSSPDRLADVPAYQRKIFANAGGREVDPSDLAGLFPNLIIDALIGYSLQGAPTGTARDLIRWAAKNQSPILSLDVPSGLDATTGDCPGDAVHPQWTLTLALPKTGLLPENCGDLWLADIGIPIETYRRAGIAYQSPFGNRFFVPLSPA